MLLSRNGKASANARPGLGWPMSLISNLLDRWRGRRHYVAATNRGGDTLHAAPQLCCRRRGERRAVRSPRHEVSIAGYLLSVAAKLTCLISLATAAAGSFPRSQPAPA